MRYFLVFFTLFFLSSFIYSLTIIIDPGHGGKDPGAIKDNIKEKDINLKVAILLRNIIEKKIPRVRTVLTRDKDKYLSLSERVDIANRYSSDNAIFISIHTNSHERNDSAKGIEIYYFDNNSEKILRDRMDLIDQKLNNISRKKIRNALNKLINSKLIFDSKKLAESIALSLEKIEGLEVRFVRPANFFVSSYVLNPSVLVEIGFLSDYQIKKDSYLSNISKGIVIGILNFYKDNRFF